MTNPQKQQSRRVTSLAADAAGLDERIVLELMRFGPRTGAELVAAIDQPPRDIQGRTCALVMTGIVTIVSGRRFAMRGHR